MRDDFLKALRWYVIALFCEAGAVALFRAGNLHSIKPMMAVVFCLGIAYILALFWQKLNKKQLLVSVILFSATAFLSQPEYLPSYLYIYLGVAVEMRFYVFWGFALFFMGVPMMTYAFRKFD